MAPRANTTACDDAVSRTAAPKIAGMMAGVMVRYSEIGLPISTHRLPLNRINCIACMGK